MDLPPSWILSLLAGASALMLALRLRARKEAGGGSRAPGTSPPDPLAGAVGPAPWYWGTFPVLSAAGRTFRWRHLGMEEPLGHLVVLEADGEGRPLLGLNTYVRPFAADPGFLGLWHPRPPKTPGPFPGQIEIVFLDLAALRPLKEFEARGAEFKKGSEPLLCDAEPADRIRIPDRLDAGRHSVPPARLARTLGEQFLTAGGPQAGPEDGRAPAASIYVWHPGDGVVDVLPQEWFTAESLDLGYQWITRVARDPATGRLVGDGIRIDPFRLDASGRRRA